MPDLEVELYGNTVKRQKDWFINALERARQHGRITMFNRVGKQALRNAFKGADLIVSASRFGGRQEPSEKRLPQAVRRFFPKSPGI